MSQETGKEKETEKQVAVSQETVDALKKEKADLLKEVMATKEKLGNFEKKAEQDKQTQLAEQGKYKELLESLTPKVQRFEKLMPVIEKLYEAEVADVPEDKRELIPQGDVETRLDWLRSAKSKGLFKTQEPEKKPPVSSVQSKASAVPGSAEYLTWDKNDPRVTRLPIADQAKWLAHQKSKSQSASWV